MSSTMRKSWFTSQRVPRRLVIFSLWQCSGSKVRNIHSPVSVSSLSICFPERLFFSGHTKLLLPEIVVPFWGLGNDWPPAIYSFPRQSQDEARCPYTWCASVCRRERWSCLIKYRSRPRCTIKGGLLIANHYFTSSDITSTPPVGGGPWCFQTDLLCICQRRDLLRFGISKQSTHNQC